MGESNSTCSISRPKCSSCLRLQEQLDTAKSVIKAQKEMITVQEVKNKAQEIDIAEAGFMRRAREEMLKRHLRW